jgi:putative membrane protein
MGFMWVIVVIAIIAVIILLKRPFSPGEGGSGPPEDAPLEILRKRYARGEISKEEFEERKRDLTR